MNFGRYWVWAKGTPGFREDRAGPGRLALHVAVPFDGGRVPVTTPVRLNGRAAGLINRWMRWFDPMPGDMAKVVGDRRAEILRIVRDKHPQPVSLGTMARVTGWPREGALRNEARALVAAGVLTQVLGRHGGFIFTDYGETSTRPAS